MFCCCVGIIIFAVAAHHYRGHLKLPGFLSGAPEHVRNLIEAQKKQFLSKQYDNLMNGVRNHNEREKVEHCLARVTISYARVLWPTPRVVVDRFPGSGTGLKPEDLEMVLTPAFVCPESKCAEERAYVVECLYVEYGCTLHAL